MNPRSLVLAVPAVLVSAGAVLYLTSRDGTEATVHAGTIRSEEPQPTGAGGTELGPIEDAPLETYQRELLELAFKTASAIPAMPHIKTRSRAQERVVGTCFELEQPRRALEFVEQIDNWRRGVGYADLAFHCAQKGGESEVPRFLELARQHAEKLTLEAQAEEDGWDGDDEALESYQSWRRDRIRAKIARTYLWLGQEEKAIEFEDGLEASESGIVEVARARTMDVKEVESVARALDSVAAEGNLDGVRNALGVGITLLERFYGDEEVRRLLQQKLEACLAKAPLMIQVDHLISIASTALENADAGHALQLVKRVEEILTRSPLAIEDDIPLRARLAGLRHRAGERAEARKGADAALQQFHAARDRIGDLQRADVLIPIAEAYAAMDDERAALEVYFRAAMDGAENPNAVPRAEDLVAVCCSMAVHAVAPDSDLWREIHKANAGLREPW